MFKEMALQGKLSACAFFGEEMGHFRRSVIFGAILKSYLSLGHELSFRFFKVLDELPLKNQCIRESTRLID